MPLYTCEGIVLRTERLEEADRLVHFFTDRFGRVRVKMQGVARTQSRLGSIAEAFSHDHLSLYKPREDRAVFSLTRASLLKSNEELRAELPRYYAASFIAEMLDCCTHDGDPHHDLWLLLLESFHLLEHSTNLTSILLAFQLKAFQYLGVGFELGQCFHCGSAPPRLPIYLSASMGGVLCTICHLQDSGAVQLSEELYHILLQAGSLSPGKLAALKCPTLLWWQSIQAFRPYWERHLDFSPRSVKYIENPE